MRKTAIVILILLFTCVSSYAYSNIFWDKPDKIKNWFNAKGYPGTMYDSAMNYFKDRSNLSEGSLYDHVNDVLGQEGYTGSIQDKLTSFFQATTGSSGRRDAERSFWSNTSYDFQSVGASYLVLQDGSSYFVQQDGTSKFQLN